MQMSDYNEKGLSRILLHFNLASNNYYRLSIMQIDD